jgi:hypothetical protein
MNDGHRFRIIAKGAEQRIRGRLWKGKRPNLLVCDDMEDDEQVENADRRRALLRELFVKYVSYDIIALDEAQFDAFIRFCDPGDELLKSWTQYEFILYVKDSYARFSARNRGLQPSDYLYSW